MTISETIQKAIEWIISDDIGISSKVIFAVMMGINPENIRDKSTPCDPSDFGRCYRLLKLIPDWQNRIDELRKVDYGYYSMNDNSHYSNLWGKFVDNYKKMCELYEEELPTGKAPKLYEFMQSIF